MCLGKVKLKTPIEVLAHYMAEHAMHGSLVILDNRQQRVVYNGFEGQWKKITE